MAKKSISVYIRESLQPEFEARGGASASINRDLERLYTMYRRALRETPLSLKEAFLIVDALNGSIMDANTVPMLWAEIEDACKLDGLDKKWGVDGIRLAARLRDLSVLHCMALVDAAERVCAAQDGDFEGNVRKCFNVAGD